MIQEIGIYLLRLLALVVIQQLVVNNIELSSSINPYIYVAFILMLPVTMKPWLVVVISFFTGMLIDAFSSTPGLHMAATTFMGYMRVHYLKGTITKEDMEGHTIPNISQKGIIWFTAYSFVLIFIHHLLLFFLEIYGFSEFFATVTRVFFSTVVTLLLIIVGQLLFFRSKVKNG